MEKQEEESEKNKEMKITLPYLDDNLKQKIFCRVPADLLQKKFKLLSKQWQNKISTPSFIDAQILHSQHGFLQMVLLEGESSQLWFLDLEEKGNNYKLCSLNTFQNTLLSAHSCNGLIVCKCEHSYFFHIMNPVRSEATTITLTPLEGNHHLSIVWIDLVFLPSTKKYKVVALHSWTRYRRKRTLQIVRRFVEEPVFVDFEGDSTYNDHIIVTEILYMTVYVGKLKLLHFDVRDERTIRWFEYPFATKLDPPPVLDMGCFLSAVCVSCSGHFINYDFWILKDASKEEWVMNNKIERCVVPRFPTMNDADKLIVLGNLNNGETVVFENHSEGKIFVYHIKTRKWRKIVISYDEEVYKRRKFTRSCHLRSLISPYDILA